MELDLTQTELPPIGTSTMLDYDEFSRYFFNRLLVERARLTRCLATSFLASAGPNRGKGRAAWSRSRRLAIDRAGRPQVEKSPSTAGPADSSLSSRA